MLTTSELSEAAGVPESTIRLYAKQGFLKPALSGQGPGSRLLFDEDAIAVARALVQARRALGDGEITASVMRRLRDVGPEIGAVVLQVTLEVV